MSYLSAHHTLVVLVSYYVFSAAIGSLPMPDEKSSKFYGWFFKFSNTLSANLSRAWASYQQGKQPPQA
jgi:hypothetical protein